MSVESPTKNIKLTVEQLLQIEEAQNRLAAIDTEIGIATKNLRNLNVEAVKTTKEKEYQQELLEKLNVEVKDAKKGLAEIQKVVAEEEVKLRDFREQVSGASESLKKAEDSVLKREKEVVASEKKIEKEYNSLKAEQKRVSELASQVEAARDAFLIASKTVVWSK